MKAHLHAPAQRLQQGVVSVIALLFLVSVVVFILMQSLSRSGSKALESQQYFDSVAALAAAESGRELAIANLSGAAAQGDTVFNQSCASYSSNNTIYDLGQNTTFKYLNAVQSDSSVCTIRVMGSAGNAKRTLESKANLTYVVGTAGYGTAPTLELHNPYNTAATAVFNLAWRRQGSTGQSPPGGQADATPCNDCGLQWNLESSSGLNSVGSLGSSLPVEPNLTSYAKVSQTLSSPRNYAEVGLVLGGFTKVDYPKLIGNYSAKSQTTNTAAGSTLDSTGTVTIGEAKGWCNRGADTLVFGVSGRGDDAKDQAVNIKGEFTDLRFNTEGTPAQRYPMKKVVHYPNINGSTPNAFGDVFSEIWYAYNPPAKLAPKNSTNTLDSMLTKVSSVLSDAEYNDLLPITLENQYHTTVATLKAAVGGRIFTSETSLTDLKIGPEGTILKVYSGSGDFAGESKDALGQSIHTRVTSFSKNAFTVSKPSISNLNSSVVCGGICALFDTPSSNAAKAATSFSLRRSAESTTQQWAGGFLCLSGVDPKNIRAISNSSLRVQQWHEVLNGE